MIIYFFVSSYSLKMFIHNTIWNILTFAFISFFGYSNGFFVWINSIFLICSGDVIENVYILKPILFERVVSRHSLILYSIQWITVSVNFVCNYEITCIVICRYHDTYYINNAFYSNNFSVTYIIKNIKLILY